MKNELLDKEDCILVKGHTILIQSRKTGEIHNYRVTSFKRLVDDNNIEQGLILEVERLEDMP